MNDQNDRATDVEPVLAIDVGGTLVKTAIVGPTTVSIERQATMTPTQPWSLDRLCGIAEHLYTHAIESGQAPNVLTVAVPGQVDDYHGVVQYSANLPWHDVPVADALGEVVPCEVLVRHDVRSGALAEAHLGAGRNVEGMLFVAIGTGIAAAGVQSGRVVADHAGAGEIGQIRIRSGPGAGHRLESFASAVGIARRFAERTGGVAGSVSAQQVHQRLGSDVDARRVWDEAVDALADALDWATRLFDPQAIILGGGLVNAGADLVDPIAQGLTRRVAGREVPSVHAAHFGADAGWVGAALIGWRHRRMPVEVLDRALAGHRSANTSGGT